MDLMDELEAMAADPVYVLGGSEDESEGTRNHGPRGQESQGDLGAAAREALAAAASSTPQQQKRTEHEDGGKAYLLQLSGPLSSPETVRTIAGLPAAPKTLAGSSEEDESDARFCQIGSTAKQAVIAWLDQHHPSFRPLLVTLSVARKELSEYSLAPVLGYDTTLPHHRLAVPPRPANDEFPVWYFFYGTLASPETLQRLLGHIDDGDEAREDYELYPARVSGARLGTWGGKYNALVDGPEEAEVPGMAFEVRTQEHEEVLRSYETCAYEVVRCSIVLEGGVGGAVMGCTFRFVGRLD